jgi:hypothetical protein
MIDRKAATIAISMAILVLILIILVFGPAVKRIYDCQRVLQEQGLMYLASRDGCIGVSSNGNVVVVR